MRDEFLITRQGKQFVLFAGLLDEAHNRGLVGIDTELMQVPDDPNGQRAIVKAIVTIEDADHSTGEVRQATFTGIGDASPDNVSRNIVPHLIRMAETRAKARALRDAVNVSAMALEEQSGTDDAHDNRSGHSTTSRNRQASGDSSSEHKKEAATGSSNVREMHHQHDDEGSTSRGSEHKAPRSQIDFIKTLAEEWRGEQGVKRLEARIGKPIEELTRAESEHWVERLTPRDHSEAAE